MNVLTVLDWIDERKQEIFDSDETRSRNGKWSDGSNKVRIDELTKLEDKINEEIT